MATLQAIPIPAWGEGALIELSFTPKGYLSQVTSLRVSCAVRNPCEKRKFADS